MVGFLFVVCLFLFYNNWNVIKEGVSSCLNVWKNLAVSDPGLFFVTRFFIMDSLLLTSIDPFKFLFSVSYFVKSYVSRNLFTISQFFNSFHCKFSTFPWGGGLVDFMGICCKVPHLVSNFINLVHLSLSFG